MRTELGVVGSPIQHSLSPVIHNAAYAHLGLDFSYQKHEVASGDLRNFLNERNLSGVSVTMPLKREAFELADSHDDQAGITGVVNTLLRHSGLWQGFNTDVNGFMHCFRALSNVRVVTILGSGATARSTALAVSRSFPEANVFVVARNRNSTDGLVEFLSSLGMTASSIAPELATIVGSDLVVSTVPGGALDELWHQVGLEDEIPAGTLFDVAYDPWPSSAATSWGKDSISGLDLLIWQAVEQVKIFAAALGAPVVVSDDELYKVMTNALNEESKLN